MTTTLKQLTHDALELPVEERARLAHDLIASIDESTDIDMSSAWDEELKKRVRDIKQGRVKGIPAEEVFAKLVEKYR
ncbi:MAG: addiction module protein [Candidatus Aminicenantes bacterium]|jgi:putative addiction module component (TIGR02574 family)